MATCSGCGGESNRIRSKWNEGGDRQLDECPNCAPGSFERFTDPSDKKIWMGYEAHPNEYEKREDRDGPILMRKPEYRAEQEQRLCEPTEDERMAQARAIAEKRAHRRTEPLTPAEYHAAIRKAAELSDWMLATANQGTDVH